MRDFLPRMNHKKKKINYNAPGINVKEEIVCFMEGFMITVLFSYFFYRSYWAVLFLSPLIWFYRKGKIKRVGEKRKRVLEQQFRDCLFSVETNLQSGYSVENAILESYPYIVGIYGNTSDMAIELEGIKKGLVNGDTLEHLLRDMGKRCKESALEEFANIYSISCKTGGGWSEVIMKIISGINQRMELRQEIDTLIHGKKQESRIMCTIPFFILFYMDMTSKGYFNVLYHNPAGIMIMSICLIAYIFSFLMSERITSI